MSNESIAAKHPINIQIFCRKLRFRCQRILCIISPFKNRSGTQLHGCTDLSTLCTDNSHTYLPLPQIVGLYFPRFWETRDQRFPGSLSLSLRRAGRREPWERGCTNMTLNFLLRHCCEDVNTGTNSISSLSPNLGAVSKTS